MKTINLSTITLSLSLLISSNFYANIKKLPDEVARAYKEVEPWRYVDFDISMRTFSYQEAIAVTKRVIGIDGYALMEFFRDLYDRYNPSVLTPQLEPRIPKIIHQVWLGSPVPEAFKQYMKTWVQHHLGRDWKYVLWTDEEVKDYPLRNRAFYDESDNYGVKSDILKWEIIYNHGGTYIDLDYECLKPLDLLHYMYDFYTAIQPLDSQFVQLGAALFAAKPGSPILRDCIETIKDDWHFKGAPTKSGPVHFTKSFYRTAGKNGLIEIAFPSGYFYPLGCREAVINRKKWLNQGAYAIHWWSKSWMPAKFRPANFRELNNDASCDSWND